MTSDSDNKSSTAVKHVLLLKPTLLTRTMGGL